MTDTAEGASSNKQDPLVGTLLAQRYQIEELLGSGGMGAVYRGQHIHMRKTFAIKVLHKEMTAVDEVVKRFEREAVAAGRIEHPNVAGAVDFGRLEDGSFYLVLEYVPGKSLQHLLKTEGALSVERTLLIARQIAAALGAAHALGIVHRDLKPDNVMLIEKGEISDLVKVLDFGIAKVVADASHTDAPLTRFGTIFGTAQYMSPEQASGQTVDGRADLYAIGLIMHEMLTGKPAFQAAELVALLTKQMLEPPPDLPDHVPPELAELIGQLLEKQPDSRPQTAQEVVQRIDALCERYAPSVAAVVSARAGRASMVAIPASSSGAVAASTAQSAPQPAALLRATAERARGVASLAAQRLGPAAKALLAFGKRRSIKNVPNWVFAAAGALLLLGVLWLLPSEKPGSQARAKAGSSQSQAESPTDEAPADDDEGDDTDTPRADEAALDPELKRVLAEARGGSASALFALEQRPANQRSKLEWLALAQGRLKQREVSEALQHFEKALSMDASLAGDRRMLGGLRYFAEKEATYETVLEFAAEHMGASGADLIFHVWSTTSRVTAYTQKAGELLGARSVQKSMSDALRIALELRDAKSCEDFKALLPDAQVHADQRSMGPLKDLLRTKGCGDTGKDDCYACLRDGPLLKETVTQVQMRRAPQFGRRRWR